MIRNKLLGKSSSTISLSGRDVSSDKEEDGEGDEENRKLYHTLLTKSKPLSKKGDDVEKERQDLIDKIVEQNKKLKEQLEIGVGNSSSKI